MGVDLVLAIPIMIEIVILILKNLFKSLSKSIGCVRNKSHATSAVGVRKKGCQICAPIIPVLIGRKDKTAVHG